MLADPAAAYGQALTAEAFLSLQRVHGNRHVNRLVTERQRGPANAPRDEARRLRDFDDNDWLPGDATAAGEQGPLTLMGLARLAEEPAGAAPGSGPTEEEKAAAKAKAAAANAAASAALAAGQASAANAESAGSEEKTATKSAAATAAEAKSASPKPASKRPGKPAAAAKLPMPEEGEPGDLAVAEAGTRSPKGPAEDSAFKATAAKLKGAAAKETEHPPAESVAAAAQAAAEMPPEERAGRAGATKATEIEAAETPPFDAAGFKAQLVTKIESLAPKTAAEADEFKDSNKAGAIKSEVQGLVKSGKEETAGPTAETAAAPPDPATVEEKKADPLVPAEPGTAPVVAETAGAAPKPQSPANVEAPLKAESKKLDDQMSGSGITEEQLRNSNEPEFQAAVEAKQSAQANATSGPEQFRQAEQGQLVKARGDAATTTGTGLQGMHEAKAQALTKVNAGQQSTKTADEQKRTEIGAEVQKMFNGTKTRVESILGGLDAKVTTAFDAGADAAKRSFENYVSAKVDAWKEARYGGWLGWAQWIEDKVAGMPPEVNSFFEQGRALYLKQMDAVIDNVVAIVGRAVTEAKAEISKGKQQIKDYLATLPAELQEIGNEAAQGVQEQFSQLAGTIDEKLAQVTNQLAQKYQENLQAIDARIDEMKEANKGLVDKAVDAVKGVIDTVMNLKNMLLNVLAEASDAIDTIILDPIKFLGNLLSGVKQGFMQFVGNIGAHLKKGLTSWLFGAVAEAGITLPETFDIKGIFSLVMQVLGMTWENLRRRAASMFGEPVVAGLEKVFDIFVKVKDEGIGAIWDFIADKLGDLKDMVFGAIEDMVVTQVIKAGVQWLIGLLGGPAGAFVKAAKAIYDVVMWFVNNGARVMSLVQSVIKSVSAIAAGNLSAAANFIESSLASAIPTVISFLASLLGLGDIGAKVKGVIEKVQEPVNKGIDWVLGKARGLVSALGKSGLGKAVSKGVDWTKKKAKQAKDFAVGKAKQGASWVKGKLGRGDSPEEQEQRLAQGVDAGKRAVEKYGGRPVAGSVLRPLLAAIRLRYGLETLTPVEQGPVWAVEGTLSRLTVTTSAQTGGADADSDGVTRDEIERRFRHRLDSTYVFWLNSSSGNSVWAVRRGSGQATTKAEMSLIAKGGGSYSLEGTAQHASNYVMVDSSGYVLKPEWRGKIRYEFYKQNFRSWTDVTDRAKTGNGRFYCENKGPVIGPNHKNTITANEVTLEHVYNVADHWNNEGNDMIQSERYSWYDDENNLKVYCKSCNSAQPKISYRPNVGPKFRGYGE